MNYDLPASGGEGAPRIDVGPTDWLDLLNSAFLLQGEARKDRFFIFADVVYLGLESDQDKLISVSPGSGDIIPVDASVNLDTQTDLDGFTMTLAGGFNVLTDTTASADVFAGVRFFSMDTKTSWNLGVDIALPGGGKWSLPYYFDIGTGDSDLTWQAVAGASYAFGWGDLLISYRHFEYDGGPQGLMEKFSFSGPLVGGRLSF